MGRRRKDAIPQFSEDESPDSKAATAVRNMNANARERDRMRVLSKGFSKLKTTLPWVPPDTKLSKLDTLRLATCYIAHLRQILTDDDGSPLSTIPRLNDVTSCSLQSRMETGAAREGAVNVQGGVRATPCDGSGLTTRRGDGKPKESGYVHPLNLTWPFSFNGRYNIGNSAACDQNRAPITRSSELTQDIVHTSSNMHQQDIVTS